MSSDSWYNSDNDNENKQWDVGGQTVEGEVIEKIDTSALKPLNNPRCTHEKKTRRPSKEFDNHDEITCDDCPMGWYVLRTEK